jgi:hypothetical protein
MAKFVAKVIEEGGDFGNQISMKPNRKRKNSSDV